MSSQEEEKRGESDPCKKFKKSINFFDDFRFPVE